MTLTLELPPELEHTLIAGAERAGLPLERYAMRLLTALSPGSPAPMTGAELVSYWRREGVLGSRPDIEDSAAHARELRARAEQRGVLSREESRL